MNTISVEELEKIDSSKITIVDVRPADQYSRGSFPGAVNIPLQKHGFSNLAIFQHFIIIS